MSRVAILAVMIPCVLAVTAPADDFDLGWWTVDGGGDVWATEPNAQYELSGTIGQPDAGVVMTGGNFTLTGGFWPALRLTCAAYAPVDFDHDCDVDLADLAVFESCASGPDVPYGGGETCETADLNDDGDVDQSDFGVFQRCYSGSNAPANPDCAG